MSRYDLSIERTNVRSRPNGRNAGTQAWKHLLFLHWEIPIDIAQSLLPSSLELDLLDGKAWVGLVPFEMEGVRPWWLPSWAGFHFLETNIRLYVHHKGEAGVYFLSLDAASWLAVKAAQIGWGLPYHYASMSMIRSGRQFQYRLSRKQEHQSLQVCYSITEKMDQPMLGSPEFFFLERYLLFVQRGQQLYRGQVYHTPYPTYRAVLHSMEEKLLHTHGLHVEGPPAFVHASTGVQVEVFSLTRSSAERLLFTKGKK